MKIIYYCYGGTHSSVLAAAIHTGQLVSKGVPSKKQINDLALYDKISKKELGRPFFYGADEFGNLVYVLGLGSKRELIKEFLLDYLKLFNIKTEEIILVAALPYVSSFTKIGGFLSRRLGLVSLGRPIVTYTLQKLYPEYDNLVSQVKAKLRNID
ncbi:DUF3189 family protein [Halanaerobacter jeridensis]|uniref:DUF3189 family protein n=1 Tax=Halanaerobacter jeridensis TaxID=706427 RepID=A0A939BNY7_9FIRM|nr:DUF3189 family protein [Halanaerobacter jeridensis]MBM7556013.1 hypothetical protein [Halanaerobacter jeridensis]